MILPNAAENARRLGNGITAGQIRERAGLGPFPWDMLDSMPLGAALIATNWEHIGDDEFIEAVDIYTDGSAMMSNGWPRLPASAGWSAVWLAASKKKPGEWGFLGCVRGPVVLKRGEHGWRGAERPTSPVAELTSFHWVLEMLTACAASLMASLWIDSTYAIEGVA